jgi:hypothetical protein
MKVFLANALSISMFFNYLKPGEYVDVRIKELDMEDVKKILNESENKGDLIISAIGHQTTADFLSEILGREITANRFDVRYDNESKCIIVFVLGERLPEGKILTKDELEQYKNKIRAFSVSLPHRAK